MLIEHMIIKIVASKTRFLSNTDPNIFGSTCSNVQISFFSLSYDYMALGFDWLYNIIILTFYNKRLTNYKNIKITYEK